MTEFSYTAVPGMIYFVGAGPGAPDLITVRGRDIIGQADLILYADSLVAESVADLARKPDAQIIGTSGMHLDEFVERMVATARAGGVVARVHSGDPALYGAVQEQMAALDDAGVQYEVIPGVTAAFAAAARLAVELTVPEVVQTIILTRAAGRTPMPSGEELRGLAAHGASLAIYLSVTRIRQVVDELLAGGGYTPDTPVVVLHRVTWPDESMVRGTLADIGEKVKAAGYTRQALILVSPALDPALKAERRTSSHLYDRSFTHRFRLSETQARTAASPDRAPERSGAVTPREGVPSVVLAVTRRGAHLAARLAAELGAAALIPARFADDAQRLAAEQTGDSAAPAPMVYHGSVVEEVRRRWPGARQLVLIMATGVAVRAIAPMLGHKSSDPAVVCLDEAGQSVIPLVGGHQAGANDLARRIAALTGGHAAITTASDMQARPALDLLGRDAGWQIDPASALTHASACLVNDEPVGVYVDPALYDTGIDLEWLDQADNLVPVNSLEELAEARFAAGLIISQRLLQESQRDLLRKSVLYRPPVLVAGLGCRRDVPLADLHAALHTSLAQAQLAPQSLAALATIDLKADEPGLQQLAADLGLSLCVVERADLASLDPAAFSPSAAQEKLDLPGVAEPCALLVAGGELVVPKQRFERCTVAVALRHATDGTLFAPPRLRAPARLDLVSIGPGDPAQMTLAAREALQAAEVVVGYQGYIDLLQPLLSPRQQVIAMPMKSELERAGQAIDLAAAGQRVALVSSGDIGVYAMAAPVFEVLHQRTSQGTIPEVVVYPGVSAVQAAAARLGAAINHDFCTISLSDLLTPWEVIERRLWAAARGDFVVAIYNPRSRDRYWQLGRAREILGTYRPATTPAALVRNVARADEMVTLTTLAELDPAQADMFSVVLVGNSQSYRSGERMVTPRGYAGKHAEQPPGTAQPVHADGDAQVERGAAAVTSALSYPVNLTHLRGAPVLVVGGGAVGERKVAGLLAVGAAVRLISPDVTPRLRALADQGQLRWDARAYHEDDLADAHERPVLVFVATDNRETNAQIARAAQTRAILCNVADVPEEGSFHLPAVHRDAGLTIAVSTEGGSPARARQVRDQVAAWLDREAQIT